MSERRTRRRRGGSAGGGTGSGSQRPRRTATARSGWRGTLDSFGGPVVVGSVVVALVFVGALVFFNRPGSSVDTTPFEPIERGQVNGRVWGDPAAPVHIVAFEDFQCPFCRDFTEDVEPELAAAFIETGRVSFEFHHMAFIGPESTRAAQATECANQQGLFWPYHDILFLRQGQENAGVFSSGNLKEFAQQMSAALPDRDWDQAAFESCLDSDATIGIVQDQTDVGRQTGVVSTPSFLINGEPLVGVHTIEEFRARIEAAEQQIAPSQ